MRKLLLIAFLIPICVVLGYFFYLFSFRKLSNTTQDMSKQTSNNFRSNTISSGSNIDYICTERDPQNIGSEDSSDWNTYGETFVNKHEYSFKYPLDLGWASYTNNGLWIKEINSGDNLKVEVQRLNFQQLEKKKPFQTQFVQLFNAAEYQRSSRIETKQYFYGDPPYSTYEVAYKIDVDNYLLISVTVTNSDCPSYGGSYIYHKRAKTIFQSIEIK